MFTRRSLASVPLCFAVTAGSCGERAGGVHSDVGGCVVQGPFSSTRPTQRKRLSRPVAEVMRAFVLCCLCAARGASARASDDGRVLEGLGSILQSGSARAEPVSESVLHSSAVVAELARMPAPFAPYKEARADPVPIARADSCDRDYRQVCPEGWLNVGRIFAGKPASYCAAGDAYAGPCVGDAVAFQDVSARAKEQWAEACLSNWPCVRCSRDFRECPMRWERAGEPFACKPSESC